MILSGIKKTVQNVNKLYAPFSNDQFVVEFDDPTDENTESLLSILREPYKQFLAPLCFSIRPILSDFQEI